MSNFAVVVFLADSLGDGGCAALGTVLVTRVLRLGLSTSTIVKERAAIIVTLYNRLELKSVAVHKTHESKIKL